MKPTVLVVTTARWFPTTRLAMALAKAGFSVEAVCPARHTLARASTVRRTHAYSALRPLLSFADAIVAAKPDLIIPGDDLATRHLHQLYSRERNNGKAGNQICDLIERSLGAAESFAVVYARAAFMQIAREESVRAPKTEIIISSNDLKKCAAGIGFPMVLKANGTSGGDGVRVVNTVEEAERAFRRLQAPPVLARAFKRSLIDRDFTLLGPSVFRHRAVVNAQAFVAGHEATSTIACWQGKVLASLHFEVLKKMGSTGHATVLRLIEHPEMAAASKSIAQRLKLSGLHGLDFMLEAHTGNAHLIEINPRATQVGHLALGLGRDLPAAFYATLTKEDVQPAPKITENDTIALFPHEWTRDPKSEFLQSAYHDVPRDEPALVSDCIRESRTQRVWYAKENASALRTPSLPSTTHSERHAVELDYEAR